MNNIVDAVYENSKKKIKIYPCHANRASQLGEDCERKLVYMRTRWEEAQPHDVSLQRVFDQGNIEEPAIIREVQDAGFDVIEQQVALSWPEHQITGHIDGLVRIDGKLYPLEIKSMSPHIFGSTFTRGPGMYEWEEVREKFDRYDWLKKYKPQLTLYLLLKEYEEGLFIFKDKSSGALAQVNLPLDYEEGEKLLQRADRINEHVKNGTVPDPVPFNDKKCGRCAFNHICCPDKAENPIKFIDDALIIEALALREQAEEHRQIYNDCDKKIKEWAKAQDEDKLVCGDWLLQKSPHGKGVRVEIERFDGEMKKEDVS